MVQYNPDKRKDGNVAKVLLRVAPLRFPTGEEIETWLRDRGFKLGEVNGMIEIEGLPKNMKLRSIENWPEIISTEHTLGELEDSIPDLDSGWDIVADIDPVSLEMNIRERWWRGER